MSTLGFDVRFAHEAEDVAGDAGEPEAGGDEPEFGCRRGGGGGGAERVGKQRGREDLEVD